MRRIGRAKELLVYPSLRITDIELTVSSRARYPENLERMTGL